MVTSSPSITLANGSNALIKAWGAAVSAGLAAVGLVKTADTGQVDWTTFAGTATSFNQVFGYEMWRLNDALQATKPVFIKVEYGTSAGNAVSSSGAPAIYTTVGNMTDGAGNLLGSAVIPRMQHCTYSTASNTSQTCFFSGDGTYFWMLVPGVFSSTVGQTFPMAFFAFDRTRDPSGAANGDGYWCVRSGYSDSRSAYSFPSSFSNNVTGACQWTDSLVFVDRNQVSTRPNYSVALLPGDLWATGADGADITFYPLLVQSGRQTYNNLFLVGFSNDLTAFSSYTTTVLGTSHTYLCLKVTPTGMANNCMLMRYE